MSVQHRIMPAVFSVLNELENVGEGFELFAL